MTAPPASGGPSPSKRPRPPSSTAAPSSPIARSNLHHTELYNQNGRNTPGHESHASTSKVTPKTSRKSSMNSSDKADKRRSSRACLECRLAKTKCHVTDNQDVCDRCAKFGFDCRFVRHHRGRKPVSKLASVDADDSLDGGAGPSRLGGLDASDDDMQTDHESDSANEDPGKHDTAADEEGAHPTGDAETTREFEEGAQRRSREMAPSRPSGSRSHSKVRLHRNTHSLHELDTNARRRIWEMLAQKIPQRGSTYTFVSKGEVAHDNLQASTSKSASKSSSNGSSKRASSPALDGGEANAGEKNDNADEEGRSKPNGPDAGSSQSAASSQHFASTFRNLLRPVDKRAGGATTAQEQAASAVAARYPRLPETLNLFGPKDPVDLGILSMAAARRLYAYYFKHLNPWGMNFDPNLVSHDAVRASSSFLYSTILYLGSRYIELADDDEGFYGPSFARPRPDDDRVTTGMSAQLGSHVRSLAITAFALGDRRMETGVAMYLSSVWKEADDHFTILYCSYAAKIMSDIPTELLSLLPSSPAKQPSDSSVLHAQRLRRNQQRQFLFHFIQEHTHLLHFAPRPNFDRGPSLLRNLLAWADDALATEDDILLCADIDSVLLQTKYKSIMERAQAQEKDTLYGGSECFLLLQSFLDELEGWRCRWELQARKIDERFSHSEHREEDRNEGEAGEGAESGKEAFAGHLPLSARMHLLSVMRSSLVMQISSIAFRASLRDINKAKPTASGKTTSATSSAFSPSALSAMDDRAEQIYYTCLDSALALLIHTTQLPSSILRHAQDMIMVLAPHAALLATYLISLPLPSLPPNASERLGGEYAKVKTRVRRRKEYERKSLELMRDTRESFRVALVREDDHVGLCAQYFDSLLNVIEGDSGEGSAGSGGRAGRSLLSNTSVLAGTKRSRSSNPADEDDAPPSKAVTQLAADSNVARSSSAGPTPTKTGQQSRQYPPHTHANTSNMDASAAETLLNLHSESQPESGQDSGSSPARMFTQSGGTGYYPGSHHLAQGRVSASTPPSSTSGPGAAGSFSPGSFVSTGMFGHFAAPSSSSIPNSPQHAGFHAQHHAHHQQHHPQQGHSGGGYAGVPHAGEFGFPQASVLAATGPGGTVTPTGAGGTGTSTPVDWTWLQSFLEVPEFSWM